MNQKANSPVLSGWNALSAGPAAVSILAFILPLSIIPLVLAFLYVSLPYTDFLLYASLITAYFVPPAGKESIIPAVILMGQPWWLISAVLVLLDVAVALFIAWNFELALRVPVLGRVLEGGLAATQRYAEMHPRIRDLSTIGLILFVFFPFQGTGAMNGSILGRLLGMDRYRVFACVTAGSLAACLTISLGADAILEVYWQDPALGIALLVLLAAAMVAAIAGWRIYRRRLRERRVR